MTNLMTPEQVKCMVKGKGTKISTVTFIKADGTLYYQRSFPPIITHCRQRAWTDAR